MVLKYLTIPSEVLQIKGLNLPQKVILGMATGFKTDGLKMNNEGIGEIVYLSGRQVSRELSDLVSRDLISIEKAQSRHRVIRFNYDAHVLVDTNLPGHPRPSAEDSTTTSATLYHDREGILPRHPCRTEVKSIKKTSSTRVELVCPDDFQTHWNSHSTLPEIRTFKAKRQKALSGLCEDPDFVESWKSAVDRLAGSPFHTGQIAGKTWRATVDWFLNPDNFVKAMELADPQAQPDYSEALNQHTREVDEAEADELWAEAHP